MYLIVSVDSTFGQQNFQLGTYHHEPYLFNASYCGATSYPSLTFWYRKQWGNVEGSPKNYAISFHLPLIESRTGLGLQATSEQIGLSKVQHFLLSYSKHFSVSNLGIFSAAMSLGFEQVNFNVNDARFPEGNYVNKIEHNDPLFNQDKLLSSSPYVDLAISFRSPALEIGLSGNGLYAYQLNQKNKLAHVITPHYYLFASYNFEYNSELRLITSTLAKRNKHQLQVDIDETAQFQNYIAGIGLRGYQMNSLDAIKIKFGGKISKKVILIYNFEIPIGVFKNNNTNTHELYLQYQFSSFLNKKSKDKVIFHPRI